MTGRGYPSKTPERVAEAIRLRETGLAYKEIAVRLGISRGTAFAWVDDPDGSKLKARKDGYRVPCTECGALVDGSKGRKRERAICHRCVGEVDKIWTRDAIILAIQEWADDHGGIPPAATDWSHRVEDRSWPFNYTVYVVFGSWNAGITAAGFEPRERGKYGRPGEDPEEVARTIELYRSGMSCAAVGEALGVAGQTVRTRLATAGEPLRDQTAAAAARRSRRESIATERRRPNAA